MAPGLTYLAARWCAKNTGRGAAVARGERRVIVRDIEAEEGVGRAEGRGEMLMVGWRERGRERGEAQGSGSGRVGSTGGSESVDMMVSVKVAREDLGVEGAKERLVEVME